MDVKLYVNVLSDNCLWIIMNTLMLCKSYVHMDLLPSHTTENIAIYIIIYGSGLTPSLCCMWFWFVTKRNIWSQSHTISAISDMMLH